MSDVAEIAKGLTEAQRRILIATCERAETTRGHKVTGHQSRAVKRLQALRLVRIEDVVGIFDRLNIYLRPEPLGLAVKAHLESKS